MSSENHAKSLGNPLFRSATQKARALAREQRAERRSELLKQHQAIHSARVDIANEHMALWYADAYEQLSALTSKASECEILEFTPEDKVTVVSQVESLRMLGWKVGQVIGSPGSLKVFVILEKE